MRAHKTTIIVAASIILALAVAFFLYVNVTANSAGKPYEPNVKWNTKGVEDKPGLVVTVGNKTVLEDEYIDSEMAYEACEDIAYDPSNMWKQVICTYNGEELYNDVFVAG